MWKNDANSISFVEKSTTLSTKKSTKLLNFCTKDFCFYQSVRKFILEIYGYTKRLELFKHKKLQKSSKIKPKTNLHTYTQTLLQKLLNLYINLRWNKIGEKLALILFFILPWNLGKHFEVNDSYIKGFLVSYLIPTIYIQDLLILGILFIYLLDKTNKFTKAKSLNLPNKVVFEVIRKLFYLFLVCLFFSLAFSQRFFVSLYFFTRVFLYITFFSCCLHLFASPKIRQGFFVAGIINFAFLVGLGFLQFNKQSSVFNNYLFMGEQPYNSNTFNIVKENYKGVSKIPPYGLFSHPNVFAGYLLVFIILFCAFLIKKGFLNLKAKIFLLLVLITGVWVLFLTKSYFAIFYFIFFAFFLLARLIFGLFEGKKFKVKKLWIRVFLLALFLVFTLTFWLFVVNVLENNGKSLQRRFGLLKTSYLVFLENPFFGSGLNSFTYAQLKFYSDPFSGRFFEPVHNVFALILAEAGIFAFIFYFLIFVLAICFLFKDFKDLKSLKVFYGFALLAIFFLSNFDHYFFTIHQTFLLFILTLMLGLTYTKNSKTL